MKILDLIAYVLVIVGALNWGLVGGFHFDLVAFLFDKLPIVKDLIYIIVGLAGLYVAYLVVKTKGA